MPVDKELWGEYAAGAFMIILRFFARWKVIGIENFGLEDAFMGVALVTYSAITALIHLITQYGSTIGQTPESVYLLTDEQVASFVIGQKLTFADWLIYLLYIWSLKSTLLAMFARLAKDLPREELILKIVIGYTAFAFLGAAISHICVCLPVHKSWQVVPYPGDACALRNLNYYLVSFFNASSDLAIIAVPVPIIFKARIPLWRRLLLASLLCSGIFVIIATILRSYYSLKSITLLPVASGWTSRETFVAAVAVSIPGIKPLFSRSRWFRFRSTADDAAYYNGSRGKKGTHELVTFGGSGQRGRTDMEEEGAADWRVSGKEIKGTRLSSDGSEDIILSSRDERGMPSIYVTKSYTLSSEQRGSSS
ncbi:hypothetical protein NW755_003185 [Fusarium falciforme]|uniref:Rhodopsin domain-containing protein n=1 Tax=Fusarium falciforme TaxID=195108 RepID=A0A9W8V588_9HYPO|nr:hypothetical protein NW755_003185 [Fusarium falciforme]KAJ4248057.1 hypothetical protein NW757_008691 [Fusarium falciforme]